MTLLFAAALAAGTAFGAGDMTVSPGTHVTSVTVIWPSRQQNGWQTNVCTQSTFLDWCDWENHDNFTVRDIVAAAGYSAGGYMVIDDAGDESATTNVYHAISGTYSVLDTMSKVELRPFAVPITNSISYVWNNGTPPATYPTAYTVESADITLPTPTRAGHVFAGWYADSSFTGAVIASIPHGSTGDKAFYAKWTAKNYTLTINPNGGTYNSSTSVAVRPDATHTTPLTYGATNYCSIGSASRTGYAFVGWWTMPTDGTQVYDNEGKCLRGDYWTDAYANSGKYKHDGDLTVYAHWTANAYSLKFNANGGSGSMPNLAMTYDVAKNLTSNAFARTGYTFAGWATNATGSVVYSNGQSVSNLTTTHGAVFNLYAKWTAKTYKFYIDPNGGTYNGNTSVAERPDASNPTSPMFGTARYSAIGSNVSRKGHTFKGWWTTAAESGGEQVYDNAGECLKGSYWTETRANNGTYKYDGDLTVYARWTANSYSIKFNANGGSGSMSNLSMTYNTAKNLTNNSFTWTGHAFAGWATNATGDVVYANGQSVNNLTATQNGVVNLYAKWTVNNYKVKFNANGGNGTMADLSMTYGVAENLTANSFVRTGYTFVGWATSSSGNVAYTDKQSVSNLTATAGATVNLYAKWTANTYELGYDNLFLFEMWANSKSGAAKAGRGALSVNVQGGSFTLANTNSAGEVFTDYGIGAPAGYYLMPVSANTRYTATLDVSGTITGQNGAEMFLFFFSSSTNNIPNSNISGRKSDTGSFSVNFTTPEDAAYMMIRFDVNNPGDSLTFGNIKICKEDPYADVTVNAVRKAYTYSASGTYGSLATPARTGYTFGGWWTGENGTGTQIEPGTAMAALSQTIYSRWTTNKYTVSFNVTGGNGEFDNIVVEYGTTYGTLPVPTRTGYTFDGWWTARDGGSQVTADTTVSITSSQTLYAHWTANVYSVTLHFDGGWITWNGSEQQITASPFVTNYTYGVGLPLPTFGKTGYTAGGWHLAEDGSDPATYSIGTSDSVDKVFWAKFTAKSYNVTLDNQGADVVGTSSVYVMFNGEFPSPLKKCPEKAGYAFAGYFAQAEGQGTQYYKGDGTWRGNPWSTAADGTIYAHWLPNDYTVTFDPGDGGAGTMSGMALKYGVETNLPTVVELGFTKEGYVFAGWKTNLTTGVMFADGQAVSNLTVEANGVVTMHATWSRGVYYVDFNANGGDGTMEPQKFSYDIPEALTSNAFTRTGYDFAGWAWNSNATTNDIAFTNCETVVNLASVVDSTNTLYAVWAAESYTVVLDANEGQGGYFLDDDVTNYVKEATVTYGESYDNLPRPTNKLSRMSFDGWKYIDGETGEARVLPATVPFSSAGVTNLVAQWTDGLATALNAEETDLDYLTGGVDRSNKRDMDTSWLPAEKDGMNVGQSGEIPKYYITENAAGIPTSNKISSCYTYVRTTLPGPGVLTFKWRLFAVPRDKAPGSFDQSYGNCLVFRKNGEGETDNELNPIALLEIPLDKPSDYNVWQDSGWHEVSFTNNADSIEVEWRFWFNTDYNILGGGTGWVDNVTWTPASGPAPGKVPFGENGASPMTVGDGQTSVSIANTVKGWWYGLYSKTNLSDTAEQWIPLEARQATSDDELISFDWLWNPAEPQRFFKIILSVDNPCQ